MSKPRKTATTTAKKTKSRTTRKTKPKTTGKTKPKAPAETLQVKGDDFILADFTGYTSEDNQLFDTTKEAIAKEKGVFDEKETYQPRLIIVGRGWMVPGVEDVLVGMKVGDTKQIELGPEKAFGVRDANQVRIIPRARIKTDQKLVRGMRVRIGNQSGTVRHVGGGRVTVDFNHPLAGHSVNYEITVTKKLTQMQEKLEAFVYRRFEGVEPGSLKVTMKGKTITVAIGADPRVLLNQSLQLWKLGFTHDVETYMQGKYNKVNFIEDWEIGVKPATE